MKSNQSLSPETCCLCQAILQFSLLFLDLKQKLCLFLQYKAWAAKIKLLSMFLHVVECSYNYFVRNWDWLVPIIYFVWTAIFINLHYFDGAVILDTYQPNMHDKIWCAFVMQLRKPLKIFYLFIQYSAIFLSWTLFLMAIYFQAYKAGWLVGIAYLARALCFIALKNRTKSCIYSLWLPSCSEKSNYIYYCFQWSVIKLLAHRISLKEFIKTSWSIQKLHPSRIKAVFLFA